MRSEFSFFPAYSLASVPSQEFLKKIKNHRNARARSDLGLGDDVNILRKCLLGLGCSSAISAAAMASEIYGPGAPAVAYVPVMTWTGFYIGAHVGGDWGSLDVTDVNGFAALASSGTRTSSNPDGVFGGGTFGYNLSHGDYLIGFEVDLGGMGMSANKLIAGTTSSTSVGLEDGFYGDVTARVGCASGDTAYYVKGGFAFLDTTRKFSTAAAFTAGSLDTFTGWTLGAGIERMIGREWSLKLEYLHFDFGSQEFSVTPGPFHFRESLTAETVKGGFAYHFVADYVPLK